MPSRPRQRWQAASFGIGRPELQFSQAISALPEWAILLLAPVRRDVAEPHRGAGPGESISRSPGFERFAQGSPRLGVGHALGRGPRCRHPEPSARDRRHPR
jgi:hypothetical protein